MTEALGGNEDTCPCRIRWAVTEQLFPAAPGPCAGFVLTQWQSLVPTPWEKCQCPVTLQAFHYQERQDENAMVTLFKLKILSISAF